MCMKYVNATTRCYRSMLQDGQNRILSLHNPSTTFIGHEENGLVSVKDFSIQTEVTIMGTANEKKQNDNPISRGDTLHFTLRLTKCDIDPEKRVGLDIDQFDIDIKSLSEQGRLSYACFPFYTIMRVTNVRKIEFPSFDTGKYVLKVLVRATNNPEDDTIQSMCEFTVLRASN